MRKVLRYLIFNSCVSASLEFSNYSCIGMIRRKNLPIYETLWFTTEKSHIWTNFLKITSSCIVFLLIFLVLALASRRFSHPVYSGLSVSDSFCWREDRCYLCQQKSWYALLDSHMNRWSLQTATTIKHNFRGFFHLDLDHEKALIRSAV